MHHISPSQESEEFLVRNGIPCDACAAAVPQHWLPLAQLYAAMERVDSVTGQPRGYLKMGAFPRLDSVLFTLERRHPYAHTPMALCCHRLVRRTSLCPYHMHLS
jgi:hypothetical protein